MMMAMTMRPPTMPPMMTPIGVEDVELGSTTEVETRPFPDQVPLLTSKMLKDATVPLDEYVMIPLLRPEAAKMFENGSEDPET